jgi:hypothetical protein
MITDFIFILHYRRAQLQGLNTPNKISNRVSHCWYSNLITAVCCVDRRIFRFQEVRRLRNDRIHKLDWLRTPWDLKTDFRRYRTSCSLETNIRSNLHVEETLCWTRRFVTVEFMKKNRDCVLCYATVWTFYIAFVHVIISKLQFCAVNCIALSFCLNGITNCRTTKL